MVMRIVAYILLALISVSAGCAKNRTGKEPVRIKITAKKYQFQPNPIRVKQGDEVLLEVSSADVQHGFRVPELGIDESVPKGKTAEISVVPAKRGEYKIECDIICGPGHDDMAGKIIVE